MTCPRPASALTSPTRTRARTVCSSPCLCPGTGVPWVCIQAAGRFLPPWAIGKVGRWASERWEHPPVPPRPPGPAHPIPAPLQCQLPALPELRAWGHGDAGTNSVSSPSLLVPYSHCHYGGASSCLQPEPGSREEKLSPAGASPARTETPGSSCPGDSSAGMVTVAAYHGGSGRVRGVGRTVPWLWALGLAVAAPSLVLAAGIALLSLWSASWQGAAVASGVPCLTSSPSRHPGQRGQAGDGVHPRRLIHGGHREHDRRQCPGQLRERDCHHTQLPRRSARYGLCYGAGDRERWPSAVPRGGAHSSVVKFLAPVTQAFLRNLAQLKANIGLWLNK